MWPFKKKKLRPLENIAITVVGGMGHCQAFCESDAQELAKRLGVRVFLKYPVEVTFFPDREPIRWNVLDAKA